MQTTYLKPTSGTQSAFKSLFNFVGLMFWASMRNLQTLVVSLGTPLAITAMFLLTGQQMSPPIVPLLFVMSVTFSGIALGTRLVAWREQKIFRRLAVTPTTIDEVLFGLFVAQLAVSITQSLILLVLILLLGIAYTLAQLIVSIWALVVACFCFTAIGPLLATFIRRVDVFSYAYVFLVMPITLISGLLDTASLQPPVSTIVALFPTSMLANLLRVVQSPVAAEAILLNSTGLIIYGVVFLFIVSRRARTFIR